MAPDSAQKTNSILIWLLLGILNSFPYQYDLYGGTEMTGNRVDSERDTRKKRILYGESHRFSFQVTRCPRGEILELTYLSLNRRRVQCLILVLIK